MATISKYSKHEKSNNESVRLISFKASKSIGYKETEPSQSHKEASRWQFMKLLTKDYQIHNQQLS